MAGELEAILNEMKGKGVGGAIVRVDGVAVQSTIALNELSSGMIASVANVSDAMMKRMDDQQKEVEVSFGNSILVMYPMKNHFFCCMINDREQKKMVSEYAAKAKNYI